MYLMAFIQGETILGLGNTVPLKQFRTLRMDFGQEQVLQRVRRGKMGTGDDWLEGQGFPSKTSRSYFPG